MDLSEFISKKLESVVFCRISLGGRDVPFITDTVVVMWIVMAVIIAAVLITTRNLKVRPGAGQNAAEAIVEAINGLCKSTIGHHWRPFAAYIGTVLIFLVVSNVIAVFNVIPTGAFFVKYLHINALAGFELEIASPAKNFNVTLALALMSMALVVFCEFRYKGVKGWLKSFYTPLPINGFVKTLDYVTRPTSLCLRLMGNMLGGLIVMSLLYYAFPIAVPAVVGIYFDIFDGALQAYVFVFLTMIYLQEATE
jgi:F-type H+-transporting ATPase subunit a